MSGGDSDTPNVHDSQGNPQETIDQDDYDKAKEENEEKLKHHAEFSKQRSKNMHIFRKAPGHFAKDTKEHRNLILSAVSKENYVATNIFGQKCYYKNLSNGKYAGNQIWVYVRNGIVDDAGINNPALPEIEIMQKVMRS